jgi:hypothetical protein
VAFPERLHSGPTVAEAQLTVDCCRSAAANELSASRSTWPKGSLQYVEWVNLPQESLYEFGELLTGQASPVERN